MSTVIARALSSGLDRLPGGAIVVGFSGGLDSTVLLHALAALPAARARGLRAVHVDHGLQAQSAQWATHCAAVAGTLGVPIELAATGALDTAGTGLEEAARTARHAAFSSRLKSGEVLALAHHADDQAETVLLKLLRGAGPEGLGGMRARRQFGAGWLWRPLLDVPRARLCEYADAHGLRWIEDPSNDDTRLRRNFLRAEILPRLQQRWPDASAAIAHSARWASAAAAFIEQEARIALARLQGVDSATLAWHGWLELPDALRDPVLRLWLRSLGLDEPAHFQVAELERQLANAEEDRAPCVRWGQCEVRRYRDLLYAMHPLPDIAPEWQAAWTGSQLALPDGSQLTWTNGIAGAPASANGDRPALQVRYRRGGERLRPAGSAHSRELRLLLQESGVPPWQRDRIPLIHAEDELIAVGDLFVSASGDALCDRLGARIVWERPED
jgi:tRNA(Ile)-lysidine synthase